MKNEADRPRPTIHIIAGPTASGKESAAYHIAQKMSAEIVSVDSMKIYRQLDIGTAKATPQMRQNVPHHCLDIAQPENEFSVADYQAAADQAIADIAARGKTVILSGGTALYYKAILEGIFEAPPKDEALREEYKNFAAAHGNDALFEKLKAQDPQAAGKLHPNDTRRVIRALEIIKLTGQPISARQQQWSGFHDDNEGFSGNLRYPFKMVWLNWERDELYRRIELRVDKMIDTGLEDEAKMVWQNRGNYARTPLQAVGYKEFFPYFSGECSLAEAVDTLKKNTRHLAKSQCTWFRKFPATALVPQTGESQDDVCNKILSAWDGIGINV